MLLQETAFSSKSGFLNLTQPDPGLLYCRTGCSIANWNLTLQLSKMINDIEKMAV
jgi:hypothetical protein